MYSIIKILIIILCLGGIIYLYMLNKKYKDDSSVTKDDIIKYFKEQNATNLENGIKVKELPKNIIKNPYLLMMVKDNTLRFEKGKYYLSNNKK